MMKGLLLLALTLVSTRAAPAQLPWVDMENIAWQIERAYQEAYGREPSAPELDGWTTEILGKQPVQQRVLVHWLMDWLRSPAGAKEHRAMIIRAYRALESDPSEADINYWIKQTWDKRPGTDTSEAEDDEAHTYWRLVAYLRDFAARTGSVTSPLLLSGIPAGCIAGYVWREAAPKDYVCVLPARRTQSARENSQAASRRAAGSTGDGCTRGYVWREATPSDHVCVTPDVRTRVAEENRLAGQRTAGRPK